MFFIPIAVNNILLLVMVIMAAVQHYLSRPRNQVINRPFITMVLGVILLLAITFHGRDTALVSMIFFAISLIGVILTYRQFRYMPSRRSK